MGERDEKIGDLIWKAFGGFDEDLALDGVFMSSRMMEGFEVRGGRNVVSKAELYVMLLEMGCMIEVYEDLGWYPDTALPTVCFFCVMQIAAPSLGAQSANPPLRRRPWSSTSRTSTRALSRAPSSVLLTIPPLLSCASLCRTA